MAKILAGNDGTSYTFDASAKTITLTGFPTLTIDQILLITNVEDNVVIYQFNLPSKGGTIAANVITLDFDTTTMSDTDPLQIWVDIPNSDAPSIPTVSTGAILARDGGGVLQELQCDDAKRLLTSQETPPAGPGETAVGESLRGNLSGTNDDEYTIPSGDTLQIRSLFGGVEDNGAGCVFSLFDDPNGDKSVLTLISAGAEIIINGDTQQNNITIDILGDGTRRIVMRAEQLTGGSYRTTVSWSGVLK